MTDYNGFGSATTTGQGAGAGGGLVWQNDALAYTFGQRFRIDTTGLSAKGARWYLPAGTPSAATTGYYIAIYDVGGTTPLATAGPFTATVGQWNEASFSSPVPLTNASDYMIAVLIPGGYYAAQTPNAFPWDPAGPINFYGSGGFNSGGTLTYPASTSGSSPSYGIDVTVTDGTSGNDGTISAAGNATTASFTGTGPVAAASSTRTSRLLARLWFTESIGLERLEGDGAYGPTFADLVSLGGAIDHGSKEVMTPTGDTRISSARVFLPVETDTVPLGSKVTLPDAHGAGTFLVVAVNLHRSGQPTPDHLELSLL